MRPNNTDPESDARYTRHTRELGQILLYPNRRLYCCFHHCYITHQEIRERIVSGRPVFIRTSRGNQDRTHYVLLKILAEDVAEGEQSPLGDDLLRAAIARHYRRKNGLPTTG